MPSIELVCIGQEYPTDFRHLSFAVVSGKEIVSHRGPRPRFRKQFARMHGCIYHLGNPDLKQWDSERIFFAYDLLSDRSRLRAPPKYLQFSETHLAAMHEIIDVLVIASPAGQLYFTSDWQFGPRRTIRGRHMRIDTFWDKHDRCKIMLNASYLIHR